MGAEEIGASGDMMIFLVTSLPTTATASISTRAFGLGKATTCHKNDQDNYFLVFIYFLLFFIVFQEIKEN